MDVVCLLGLVDDFDGFGVFDFGALILVLGCLHGLWVWGCLGFHTSYAGEGCIF